MELEIVEGREVERHGKLQNPYLKGVVRTNSRKLKFKTSVKRKTRNPIWHEHWTMTSTDPSSATIYLKLKSKASVDFENALIGEQSVRLNDVVNAGDTGIWVNFRQTHVSFGSGSVLLRISLDDSMKIDDYVNSVQLKDDHSDSKPSRKHYGLSSYVENDRQTVKLDLDGVSTK